MKLKNTSRIGAAVMAAIALTSATQAAFINGGISFFGAYTPQDSSAVTQADLANATQIAFGPTVVFGTSGDFTAIPNFTPVTMFTPLVFAPTAVIPGPSLWTVTSGLNTFSFNLTSFSPQPVQGTYPAVQTLDLWGTGLLTYSGPLGLTSTPGSWVGTFNAGKSTFTWSSSTAAVPDGGTTIALLGFSLLGLHGIRRKFAKA